MKRKDVYDIISLYELPKCLNQDVVILILNLSGHLKIGKTSLLYVIYF